MVHIVATHLVHLLATTVISTYRSVNTAGFFQTVS